MKTIIIFIGLAFFYCQEDYAQKYLAPGQTAPSFARGVWIQGKEISSFELGKVYVIEFWATWCKGCVEFIPEFNKLYHKYQAEVEFIGVNVMDEPHDRKRISAFVDRMGPKMEYPVVIDTTNQMEQDWLIKAGVGSIPCSFIVDKKGKVAWFGLTKNMDSILNLIVNDKFYYSSNNLTVRQHKEVFFLYMPISPLITEYRNRLLSLLNTGNIVYAKELYDSICKKDTLSCSGLTDLNARILLQVDTLIAYSYVLRLVTNKDRWMFYVMAILATTDNLSNRFYELSRDCLRTALENKIYSGQSFIVEGLSEAYFHLGDYQDAFDNESRWLEFAMKVKFPQQVIQKAKDLIAKYKSSLSKELYIYVL